MIWVGVGVMLAGVWGVGVRVMRAGVILLGVMRQESNMPFYNKHVGVRK